MLNAWEIWTGWAIAAAGFGVLVAEGFMHRRRRGSCRRCGYRLQGLPHQWLSGDRTRGGMQVGGTRVVHCPECNRTNTELDLLRGRVSRRWVALAGALLIGGPYLGFAAERRAEGWRAFVPTLAMVVLTPREHDDGVWAWWWDALCDRHDAGRLPEWQHRLLIWRWLDLSEERAWELVRVPEVWVRGVPIPVRLYEPDLVGELLTVSAEVQFGGGGLSLVRECERDGPTHIMHSPKDWMILAVDVPYWGYISWSNTDLQFPAELRLHIRDGEGTGFSVSRKYTFRREYQIRMVDSVEKLIRERRQEPVHDAPLDGLIAKNIRLTCTPSSQTWEISDLTTMFEQVFLGIYDERREIAIQYDVEVWEGDRRIWRASRDFTEEESRPSLAILGNWLWTDDPAEREALFDRLAPNAQGVVNASGLTLRIISNPEAAAYDVECDRYWAGQVEVPLDQVLEIRGGPASP